MTDEKSEFEDVQGRIRDLETRRRGLQEKRAALSGNCRTEADAVEVLHAVREIDNEVEEIDVRLDVLRRQSGELNRAVGDQDNADRAREHDRVMTVIFQRMRTFNDWVRQANQVLDEIGVMIATLPSVRTHRQAPGGGMECDIVLLPPPWVRECDLRRRVEPLEIINEKHFTKGV